MVIQGVVKFSSGGYKIFPLKNTNFGAKFLLLIFFEILKIQNFLGMLILWQRFFYLLFTPRLKTRQPVLPQHAIALLLIYQKFVSNLFTMHFISQKCLLTHLKSLGKKKKDFRKGLQYIVAGPPREARQARLGPCLDCENQKAAVVAVARRRSGCHYGCLACQKSTVAALSRYLVSRINGKSGKEKLM